MTIRAPARKLGRLPKEVISNAGIAGVIAPVAEYPEDVFDQVMAVHVRGSFLVRKHALPFLQSGASIVITSSVVGLMRTLAKECAPRGIRVNTIHPGPVDNEFQHRIEAAATGATLTVDGGMSI